MPAATRSGTQGYAEAAPFLLRTRLQFEQVHEPILHLLPTAPMRVLDIGSGPGHDAACLAGLGHAVVAAEPTPELLRGAAGLYGSSGVLWLEDGLPDLTVVKAVGWRFALVLVSGVWMHLDAAQRREAMTNVAGILEPDGVLAVSLRHGPVPPGRCMFQVGGHETIDLAAGCGLSPVVNVTRDSIQPVNRAAGVTWTHLAFSRPKVHRSCLVAPLRPVRVNSTKAPA